MDSPDILNPLELPIGTIESKDGEFIIRHSAEDDRPVAAAAAVDVNSPLPKQHSEDFTAEISVGEQEIAETLENIGYEEYVGNPKITQGVGYVLSTYDFNFENKFDLQDLGSYNEKHAVIRQMLDRMNEYRPESAVSEIE